MLLFIYMLLSIILKLF